MTCDECQMAWCDGPFVLMCDLDCCYLRRGHEGPCEPGGCASAPVNDDRRARL